MQWDTGNRQYGWLALVSCCYYYYHYSTLPISILLSRFVMEFVACCARLLETGDGAVEDGLLRSCLWFHSCCFFQDFGLYFSAPFDCIGVALKRVYE
jgi:hypothetical protein